MNAEERHRLHENDLERLTEQARMRARPFVERHGTTLLLALAGVIVLIAAVVFAVRYFTASDDAGWTSLAAALRGQSREAEKFAGVAEEYPDSAAATWAKLMQGEAQLRSGMQSLYVDREGALRDLGDARKAFESALDAAPQLDADARPELEVRALFGLARVLEASSTGDLKPAIDRYQQVAREFPDTVFATFAVERAKSLSAPDAAAFYAWFGRQKAAPLDALPKPRDSGPAFGGLPGLEGLFPGGTAPAPDATASPAAPVEAPRPATTEAAPSEPTPPAATPPAATPPAAAPEAAAETVKATDSAAPTGDGGTKP